MRSKSSTNLNRGLTSAYYLIGNTYAAQNEFDAAVNEYKTVIEKNPKAIPAYMMLGIVNDLQKQPSKANEYYQKVLALNKNFPLAANNLAWNYAEHGGDLDVALNLAQKARETDPNSPGIADTLLIT